jgi:prephenate dehydrogenase
VFERVAIVGVGLIGGSLGLALRERRLARSIVGIGRNQATLDRALARHAIGEAFTEVGPGVAGADLVVLCTPISRILHDLEALAPVLAPGAVITDVGSTKSEIAAAGDRCYPDGRFVPGHPMAGSERSGVDAARAELFMEATWALTPTAQTDAEALSNVRSLAAAVGARVVRLTPAEHDEAVAVTSHLPHVLAYALAAVAGSRAGGSPHLYDLAAGSFTSGTRVAHSDPALWREIALSNRDALLSALRESADQTEAVIAALEARDGDALETAFRRGYEAVEKSPA